MGNFGGGDSMPSKGVNDPFLPPMARVHLMEMRRRQHGGGHRPPKRPRFGLLRRLVRAIRGGGD